MEVFGLLDKAGLVFMDVVQMIEALLRKLEPRKILVLHRRLIKVSFFVFFHFVYWTKHTVC